ncbi:MAG: PTS system mannose/fructose/N-acetylgalactosamine-transporter subunit IIB [Gemmatimonadota bacterium]
MKVLLFRVDDRLIHGQVILGWGRRFRPQRLIVVDDRIAGDPWERELLGSAAPPEVAAEFLSVGAAARALRADGGPETAFVLLETPRSAVRLAEAGYVVPELNLGGLHREGGLRLTAYLFLSPDDVAAVRALHAAGTRVYAQDVPDARRLALEDLLREQETPLRREAR